MANNTDTVYRIYGSTETIIKIAEKITSGMTLRKAVKVVGYKEPDVTKELAASIRLYDDFTPTGGIAHINEHLDEFMEEQKIPYGIPLERVNTALKECGITPVHTDNFNMRGISIMSNRLMIANTWTLVVRMPGQNNRISSPH